MALLVFSGLAVGCKCLWGIYVPNCLRLWEGNLKEYLPSPEKENVTPRETNRVRVSGELGSQHRRDSGHADKGKPHANLTSELGRGRGAIPVLLIYTSYYHRGLSFQFSVKYPKTASPWNEQYYCTLICQKSRTMAALSGLRTRSVIQTVAIDECVLMCLG